MTRKYETCTHGAGPILWPVALQHQQTASNRPWIATGDGTTDTFHKSPSSGMPLQAKARCEKKMLNESVANRSSAPAMRRHT